MININWITTDEFLMLNHEVSPSSGALTCNQCHVATDRIDFGGLGYTLKMPEATLCTQCHGRENMPDFVKLHDKHRSEGISCISCHSFNR